MMQSQEIYHFLWNPNSH